MTDYERSTQIVSNKATSNGKSVRYRRIRANIAYFIFGICNNFGYVVMLTAAADIISDQTDTGGDSVSILLHSKSNWRFQVFSHNIDKIK